MILSIKEKAGAYDNCSGFLCFSINLNPLFQERQTDRSAFLPCGGTRQRDSLSRPAGRGRRDWVILGTGLIEYYFFGVRETEGKTRRTDTLGKAGTGGYIFGTETGNIPVFL